MWDWTCPRGTWSCCPCRVRSAVPTNVSQGKQLCDGGSGACPAGQHLLSSQQSCCCRCTVSVRGLHLQRETCLCVVSKWLPCAGSCDILRAAVAQLGTNWLWGGKGSAEAQREPGQWGLCRGGAEGDQQLSLGRPELAEMWAASSAGGQRENCSSWKANLWGSGRRLGQKVANERLTRCEEQSPEGPCKENCVGGNSKHAMRQGGRGPWHCMAGCLAALLAVRRTKQPPG